jgi:hypothetical protein
MRRSLSIALLGGLLLAVGLYLFPMYVGQEMFVDWLASNGGGYWAGVVLAGIFAGAIIIAGLYLLRPGMFAIMSNPIMLGVAVVVIILLFFALQSVWGA